MPPPPTKLYHRLPAGPQEPSVRDPKSPGKFMAQAIFEVVAPSDVEDPRATRGCGTSEALCDLVAAGGTCGLFGPTTWVEPLDANIWDDHSPTIETSVAWSYSHD